MLVLWPMLGPSYIADSDSREMASRGTSPFIAWVQQTTAGRASLHSRLFQS